MRAIHGTTACWPGERHTDALGHLLMGTEEPALGMLSCAHVQLCPQNFGVIDEALCDELKAKAPGTAFRLHASVRVFRSHRTFDASCADSDAWHYFGRVAELSAHLRAPAYTLHAGERQRATKEEVRDNVLRLQDRFGIPVGVEALYPAAGNRWLLSSWAEYAWLLATDIHYVIDLSHVAIVAHRERREDLALVLKLVNNPRCLEVHVSDNDGRADEHRLLARHPWWWPVLDDVHPATVVFSEGNQRRKVDNNRKESR